MADGKVEGADGWTRARELRERMRMLGQMIQGTINFRAVTCGKPGCRCARGARHRCVTITGKVAGKTRTVYVAPEFQREAELMCANYQRHKELLKELTRVNLELIRSRGRRRAARAGSISKTRDLRTTNTATRMNRSNP